LGACEFVCSLAVPNNSRHQIQSRGQKYSGQREQANKKNGQRSISISRLQAD